MDKKAKKKRSKIDMSDSGSTFVRDPDKGKKKKEERKKEHAADKRLNSNETLEENCTGEAADKQTCSIEGNIMLMGNKEDKNHENKRKKKNRRKDVEATNSNIADDKEVQFLDDNQERKMKKRKKYDCSLKSNEGEDDDQGKHMKKKKKLGEENRHGECNEFKGNDLKDDYQDKKKMKKKEKKKKLSEEGKSKEFDEFKTNEGEADDQGKQMKKKKKSVEESQHKESIEFKGNEHKDDYQDKKMKKKEKKKKLRDKSKSKENSEFNEGNPPVARVTEVDDQGKKMKVKKKDKAGSGESPNPGSSKPKRVTFSDQVDICCDGLVRGKWFTPEEDEKIKAAVHDYIESHGLGDEGLDMILHCKSHPEVRHCWKEIGAALPDRPNYSVYYRAHILFERDEKRKWTPEELDFLRKVQEQHGSDWKSVAEALGKHRFHVKDAWRRIKLTNTNKGRWTQEEYQKLFDLVNLDLCARASAGYRKSKHGMLRDNIGWEAIGDKLATRTSARCCKKWYNHLTSPMVANGDWSDADDYRMLNALFTLDACSMEEVDWDNLLEHRPGDVCRRRWNQMVRYIGEHGGKPFAEQVEILAKRFCPDLMEVREAFDEKPVVC